MVVPLVPGAVADGYAGDGQLALVGGQDGLRADGAEEGVPAVGDGWGVEQGEVKRLERTGGAAGGDAVDDGLFGFRRGGWRVGDVGETHFGGWSGGE